jgi:isopenicillin-N epimerase
MTRRDLFKSSAAAAALFGIPASAAPMDKTPALPDQGLLLSNPEAYWRRIRDDQFLLPGWRAFLNNGSLGIAPRPVLDAVTSYLERSAALDLVEYPRWGYEPLDEYRTEMAEYLGCAKDELAFMHNATEAMGTIAAGLDLKAGDEVLTTDQEHPSGRSGWLVRQARHGITVREVKIPLPPRDPGQLADLLVSSIGPQTRVLIFSGITTATGLIFPMREICEAARAKGVITVVDGAHVNGQIPVRLSDIGCDLYVGSPHKWMFAPAGCGLLYLRGDMVERLWPTVVTAGWDDKKLKAARYMQVGTNNRAIFEGMMAGLRFAKAIGPERIYARTHELARMVRAKAADHPYIELLTPDDDRMYGALVTLSFKNGNPEALWKLTQKRRIWTIEGARVRISTHIHTRPEDIDLFFGLMREALG